MKKEQYLLKNQIHFGSIKTLVPAGTVVTVNRDDNSADFNGIRHENIVGEVDMMIRAGYIIPRSEKTVVDKKPLPNKKNGMEIIREKNEESNARGISVIRNDGVMDELDEKDVMNVINDETRYIPIKPSQSRQPGTVELASSNEDLSDVVNGQDATVVKTIGKGEVDAAETNPVLSGKKLTAKHSDDSAKQRASERSKERKESMAKRRANAKKEGKED